MKLSIFARFALLCTAVSAATAWAHKDAELKPAATTPGKLIFADNFDEDPLDMHWLVTKGSWQIGRRHAGGQRTGRRTNTPPC